MSERLDPRRVTQQPVARFVGGQAQATSRFWFAYIKDRLGEFYEWHCDHHHCGASLLRSPLRAHRRGAVMDGLCGECGLPLTVSGEPVDPEPFLGEPHHVFCDVCGGVEHPADMTDDWDGENGRHLSHGVKGAH